MHASIQRLVFALGVVVAPFASASGGGGGECLHGETALELVDGYAWRAADPFEDGKQQVRIALTSVPLDRSKLAGAEDVESAIREQVWDKDGGQVVLTLDAASVVAISAFIPPGTSTSRSGTAFGDLALDRNDDKGIAGTFDVAAESDREVGCRVRFDLAYATAAEAKALAAARGGKPLPPGGGDPGKVFLANVAAMQKGDVPGLLATLNAEQAAKLRADQAKPDFAAMLGMMQAFAPKRIKVVGGRDYGDSAELDLEGSEQDGAATSGTARLVKESGAWKVERTSLKTKSGG